MTSMPKGGFVGQGFCGFLPHIYVNVVIVQHDYCCAQLDSASAKYCYYDESQNLVVDC